jgi:hypothetical protein
MPIKHGTDLGGVRSLEALRQRCRIDADTGCWRWGLSSSQGQPRVALRAADGVMRTTTGRRAALVLVNDGKLLPPRTRVFQADFCPHWDCVCPSHAIAGTPAQAVQAAVRRGALDTPARRAVWAKNRCNRSKLTVEQRMEIGADKSEPAAVVAARYGISVSRVLTYRRGQVEVVKRASSVFDWRPA